MTKVLIVTALKAEAIHLISEFKLIKDSSEHVYTNKQFAVVICGIGKNNIEPRLDAFISNQKYHDKISLLNVGICGGDPKHTLIGKGYILEKIIDAESKKVYRPNSQLGLFAETKKLTTVQSAVTNGERMDTEIVDMEASEIFRVGSKWISPKQMVFYKIVSDYMDCDDWTSLPVSTLIKNRMKEIRQIINCFLNHKLN